MYEENKNKDLENMAAQGSQVEGPKDSENSFVMQQSTEEPKNNNSEDSFVMQQSAEENETSNIYRFTKEELQETQAMEEETDSQANQRTEAQSNIDLETGTNRGYSQEASGQYEDYSHTQNIWKPNQELHQSGNHVVQSNSPKAKKKNEKKHTGRKIVMFVAGAVAFGAIAFGAFLGADYAKNQLFPKENRNVEIATTNTGKANVSVTTTSTAGQTTNGATIVTDVSDVVEEVMPSIVAITSTQYIETGRYGYFWGNSGENTYEAEGAGSGIILAKNDKELLIVTNEHVVADADSLSVQFADGESVEAYTKGTDSDADLAIVSVPLDKIKSETLASIKIAAIGDSNAVKVGEGAIAIGNALGYGQSVTTGVISAVDREVSGENGSDSKKLLQTDAAINPGNSGGALLNVKGEVIGINELKYSSDDVEGMGFAIPISSATEIINNLMNQETKTKVDEDKRGYLNIVGFDVDSKTAQTYGLEEGVFIEKVIEGGAAQKAGLEEKDIIVKINDTKIGEMTDLQKQLQYYAVGDKVNITIKYADGKEYKEKTVEVTLGKQMSTSDDTSQGSRNNQPNGENGNSGSIFDYFGW